MPALEESLRCSIQFRIILTRVSSIGPLERKPSIGGDGAFACKRRVGQGKVAGCAQSSGSPHRFIVIAWAAFHHLSVSI